MQVLKRTFTANETQNVAVVGRYLWLKGASGQIYVETNKGESAQLVAGDFVRFDEPFDNLTISDESGAANSITFNASLSGEAGKWSNLDISTPGTLVTTADVTLTAATKVTILAANSDRREALIQVDAATRIGDTNTGAARGVEVAAGGSIILDTTAEIFGYCAAGGTATVTEIEA